MPPGSNLAQAAPTASGQEDAGTFKLDGRGERARLSAIDCVKNMRSKLGGIKFEECQETVTAFSGQALDQFKKLLKEKTQVAAEVKGTLKTMLSRLDKSVTGDQGGLAAEIDASIAPCPCRHERVQPWLRQVAQTGGRRSTGRRAHAACARRAVGTARRASGTGIAAASACHL